MLKSERKVHGQAAHDALFLNRFFDRFPPRGVARTTLDLCAILKSCVKLVAGLSVGSPLEDHRLPGLHLMANFSVEFTHACVMDVDVLDDLVAAIRDLDGCYGC